MISNLRPPRATGTARSRSRSMTFVATLAPPPRHNRVAALSIANHRRPNTQSGARSSMMAKGVEKTATTTLTHREEERKTETAQQDHSKQVGFVAGEEVGMAGGKSWARSGSATKLVRARQGVPSGDCGKGVPPATLPRLTGIVVISFGVVVEPLAPKPDHHRGHIWVSVLDHGQIISPADQKAGRLVRDASRRPIPPRGQRQGCYCFRCSIGSHTCRDDGANSTTRHCGLQRNRGPIQV